MSSDARIWIRCKGCGESQRIFRIWALSRDVDFDEESAEFVREHLSCADYSSITCFSNPIKEVGFELIRKNDGDTQERAPLSTTAHK